LYDAGVRYKRERAGRERWKTWEELLRDHEGDCEDLAAARAAELRASGEPGARAFAREVRPGRFHAVVRRADGRTEDPSRQLGMGARVGEDAMVALSWSLRRTPQGWEGTINLPGGLKATGTGASKPDAMRGAAALAAQAIKNPALRALLPPQAEAAIRAAGALARSAPARAAWRALKSSGLRKLARKLF
jgi:hypothetical protein